jgi:hypothetical protein
MIEENPDIPLDDVWGPQVRKGLNLAFKINKSLLLTLWI